MEYRLQKIGPENITELQALSRETFKATFAPFTRKADMDHFLATAYATTKLVAELTNPESRFYFLVVNDDGEDKLAGYLKLNVGSAQTETIGDNCLEVERIYLRTAFQHRGLGLAMLRFAEKTAQDEGYAAMWLGVYEHNIVARRFYTKFGFKKIGEHVYPVGADPQVDHLMLKKFYG